MPPSEKENTLMNKISKAIALLSLGVAAAMASAGPITIPEGTDVKLKFMQKVDSRKVHAGDKVNLAVAQSVVVAGKTVIPAGTAVMGVIEKVTKNDHFGKNASIRLALTPVRVHGTLIPLAPRDKQSITGRRSDTAAAASAGGAVVLGPIGLIGGYFVKGKPVKIQIGDPLVTSVTRTVAINY
jgi:hypothetical protein